jgi:hypothetical protein
MKKAGNPEGPAFEKYHVRRQATISNVLRIGSRDERPCDHIFYVL